MKTASPFGIRPGYSMTAVGFVVCALLHTSGCFDCGALTVPGALLLGASLVDSERLTPLSDTSARVTVFLGEQEDGSVESIGPVGLDPSRTSSNGAFQAFFYRGSVEFLCDVLGLFPPPPDSTIPLPQEVEIVVLREECEQRFRIPINAETAAIEGTLLDPNDPDSLRRISIELREMILVPPCNGSAASGE